MKPTPQGEPVAPQEDFDPTQISLCKSCYCMTKTIKGKCGKCREPKPMQKSPNLGKLYQTTPQSGKRDSATGITKEMIDNAAKYSNQKQAELAQKTDSGKEWEWALKELGWDEPKYGWTHEKKVLRALIKKVKQGGL